MKERGGILIFLIILFIFIGGIILTFKLGMDSVPGESLYRVKGFLEELQLATTELGRGQRALMYMDFADRRLDELVKIESRGGNPKQLLGAAELFWEEEQKAIKVLERGSSPVDLTEAKKKLLSVNQKAGVIFNRILDKIPAPQFYSFLEIKQQVENTTEQVQQQ